MYEEKTIVYSYNKDTKIYTISDKEMQKINRQLKERFTLRQEKKQLQNNWKELKKWCKENVENVEWTSLSEDYLNGLEDTLKKMQELEGNNETRN